jgi:hypothetical protein
VDKSNGDKLIAAIVCLRGLSDRTTNDGGMAQKQEVHAALEAIARK